MAPKLDIETFSDRDIGAHHAKDFAGSGQTGAGDLLGAAGFFSPSREEFEFERMQFVPSFEFDAFLIPNLAHDPHGNHWRMFWMFVKLIFKFWVGQITTYFNRTFLFAIGVVLAKPFDQQLVDIAEGVLPGFQLVARQLDNTLLSVSILIGCALSLA